MVNMVSKHKATIVFFILETYVSTIVAEPITLATGAALASAVVSGASLLSTSLQKIIAASPTDRSCTIEIRNYHLDLELLRPDIYMTGGRNYKPPSPGISPGNREACQFIKTAGSATGTCGVLSYEMYQRFTQNGRPHRKGDNWFLNIMWCVTYSGKSNYQAIEITKGYQIVDYNLFKKLYYGGGNFVRKEGGKTIVDYHTIFGNIGVHTISVMNNEDLSTLIVELR